LKGIRPDLTIQPVRGNVDTRLRKLKEGQYDAILLAAAALRRLGLESEIAEILEPEQLCPAAGQGALAIETRDHDLAYEICRQLNHEASSQAVACERVALARLGGGCQLPVGAFAESVGESLRLTAVVVSPDGLRHLRASAEGRRDQPAELGRAVAEDLLSCGAGAILSEIQ
jgi:hydroxymethylbilane synthase